MKICLLFLCLREQNHPPSRILAISQALVPYLARSQVTLTGFGFTSLFAPKNLSDWVHGAQVDTSSCSEIQQRSLKESLHSAREIAYAALEVTLLAEPTLFSLFFNITDRSTVELALGQVIKILSHRATFPVVITCKDIIGYCKTRDAFAYLIASDFDDHQDSLAPMVVCERFFTDLPDLPDPCNQASLAHRTAHTGFSRASTIVHELVHITHIAGPQIRETKDFAYGAYAARALESKDDPMMRMSTERLAGTGKENADSYAVLAAWAWMREIQGHRCPEDFPLWGVVENLSREGGMGNATTTALLVGSDFGEADAEQGKQQSVEAFAAANQDVVVCDGSCRVPCAQRAKGTLPSGDGCYPPLFIGGREEDNVPKAWGTYLSDDVPPDFRSGAPDFATLFCPDAIATLCAYIGRGGNEAGNHDVWVWAVGQKKGCLAAVWLPGANAVPYPDREVCERVMEGMRGALVEGPMKRGRVSVNLARAPTMPDQRVLVPGFVGPILVEDRGVGLNGSVSSWLLQG